MRCLTPLAAITNGHVLAESIYDAQSRLLLREGVALSQRIISILMERGRTSVYVRPANMVDECDECGTAIALILPENDAKSWICKGCGAVYFGEATEGDSELDSVDVVLEPSRTIDLPPEVCQTVTTCYESIGLPCKQRKFKRLSLDMPVTIVPLNNNFKIIGDAIQIRTRDVSQGGLGLTHVEPTDCPNLYVDLQLTEKKRMRMLTKVARVEKHKTTYHIGCEFVSRVSRHAERLPKCSVAKCASTAVVEAFLVGFDFVGRAFLYEQDKTCPYLCRDHAIINEKEASGFSRPTKPIHYPYTNRKRNLGQTVYKPLKGATLENESENLV